VRDDDVFSEAGGDVGDFLDASGCHGSDWRAEWHFDVDSGVRTGKFSAVEPVISEIRDGVGDVRVAFLRGGVPVLSGDEIGDFVLGERDEF